MARNAQSRPRCPRRISGHVLGTGAEAGSIPGGGATAAWLLVSRGGSRSRPALHCAVGDDNSRISTPGGLPRVTVRATTHASRNPSLDYSPLIAAIDALPDRLRTPVVLHYFEGIATEAIAARLGCRRGTVLSRLARARDRLRRRLERRGFSLDVLMPATFSDGRMFSSATVPAELVQSTVRAVSSLALAGHVFRRHRSRDHSVPVESGRTKPCFRRNPARVGGGHAGHGQRRDRAFDGRSSR